MAENVYEILKSNHPALVREVIDKNEELSKFIMLVYSHTLYAAMDQKGDPKDIVFTYSIDESESVPLLKIDMKYYESEGTRLGAAMEGKSPVKRNLNLVRLLQSNSNVRDFPIKLVEVLERWVSEKPYRKEFGLKALKFENAMFWKNLIFTAELIFKVEWEEMVKAKTKFFDEEELTNEHPMVQGGYLI
jgi:hypothetical protein